MWRGQTAWRREGGLGGVWEGANCGPLLFSTPLPIIWSGKLTVGVSFSKVMTVWRILVDPTGDLCVIMCHFNWGAHKIHFDFHSH